MGSAFLLAACLVATLAGPSPVSSEEPGSQATADSRHRVVMHLNAGEEHVQKGALNNIRNLYQELGGEQLKVELVVHGAGLGLLTKNGTRFAEELERLKGLYGVSYTACSNTMKAMNLTREDLLPQVDRTVPAMVRLMELQENGWTYIKP